MGQLGNGIHLLLLRSPAENRIVPSLYDFTKQTPALRWPSGKNVGLVCGKYLVHIRPGPVRPIT